MSDMPSNCARHIEVDTLKSKTRVSRMVKMPRSIYGIRKGSVSGSMHLSWVQITCKQSDGSNLVMNIIKNKKVNNI